MPSLSISEERPRRLPLATPARRHLPLAPHARASDRTRPRYAVWEVTLRCDLACHHCSSRAGRARPDELTTEEALGLIDQMADLGVLEVTLIGGEVYLRDDWTLLVRAIKRRGMECTIVTGGRGLAEDRARAMRDAGVDSVSVSLDGIEATHDALRGVEGSHASAKRALSCLADAGVQVSANTQIGRNNRRDLVPLFETLKGTGIHSWQLQLTVAGGRAADHPELLLEPYHLVEVMPAVMDVRERAAASDIRIWPGNNLGYYGPFESALRRALPSGRKGACGAGRFLLGVESNGAIKGCPSLPSAAYVGGNVRDAPLLDIWERAEALRFTRERTTSDLSGYCATCYYAEDCLGGCSWTAHSLFGRRGNNPYCHHRVLDLLRQGKRERVVRVAAPAGAPFDHGRFEIVLEDWPPDELLRAREVARGATDWVLDSPRRPLP